jgi:predicted anti-sigma-YlaC factor YlaD
MHAPPRRQTRARGWAHGVALAALLLAAPTLAGCSIRKLAIRTVGNALASGADVYATDDDPELVGAALPFALKTIEGLLAQDPTNRDLLLAAGRGFTQYAYGFVQMPADALGDDDFERVEQEKQRALKLYLRARGYSLRGLETTHPGIGGRLQQDPAVAAAELQRDDVPLAYWTAAAWGAAIGLGKDRPELLADLPAVRALLERVLALDESWQGGAVHQAFITLEAATPGPDSMEKAKQHFARAVELANGHDASPYVAYAEAIAIPSQDRAAFESMLETALAVDLDAQDAKPDLRLANTLAQRKARRLQAHVDDYFLGDEGAVEGEESPPADDDGDPNP